MGGNIMKKLLCLIAVIVLGSAAWHFSDVLLAETDGTEIPVAETPVPASVYVYVSGAVRRPGLYSFDHTVRVGEAVQAAGNALAYADVASVNYAEEAEDGMHIHIPYDFSGVPAGSSEKDGLININEADETDLNKLPGIGPAIARRIIEYRMENGMFTSAEELKHVKGIGESKFEQLRDKVTV